MFGTRGLLRRIFLASHGVAWTDTYSGESRYSMIRFSSRSLRFESVAKFPYANDRR
ncbi:hypothetical protein D3C83_151880 [compost metagenome]